ncbi:MAG TPA: hypothetical protein VJ260_11075 [Vicinamibacterales bacterium]|nr:hypothetical protein [Vicinamibacterales bacterium]
MPDRLLSLSRHSFLGRKISRHFREFHKDRRRFLTSAAGAAGLAFWLPDGANAGQGKGKGAAPKPIAGGAMPLGIFIHHFPVLPTATPLSALNEPSQITDFKGYVGLNRIRGGGTSPQFAQTLAFQADMGFMKGQFIAEDGNLHQGVFGFI